MPKYKISSGAIYDIPEEKVQDFLFKYPDAVLVEEQGKEKGPVTEAAVAGPKTQVSQPAADTASVLEDTSLDLPPTETFSIDGKEVTKKEFDKYTALQEAARITNETDTEDPSIWDKIGYELFKAKEYSLNALEDLPERVKKVFLETKAVANDFIKNTAGEDAADFFFGENVPEGQIAFIDPETNKEVLYSENPNKWKELANLNARTDTYIKSVYSGTDIELGEAADKKYIEVMNQAKKLGEEMQTTGGGMVAGFKGLTGVEGYEEYGAADVLGGGFSAVLSVLETAVPAVLTRGASVFPQIAAPMFADYNRTKAETLYAGADNALDLLVENNEVEFTTPLLLSTVAVQAERLGLKGLSKYIMKAPLASKSVLNIARLSTISSGEGMVEVAQGMTDAINTSIAEGKSTEQVSEQVIKYLGSDQALDDFLGGFVGQAGAGAGGRAINRVLRGGNQGRAKVNTLLTDLNNLKAAAKQTKNKISKDIIQENIAQKEAELKKYLEENNKIAQQLTDVEKQELLGLLETKDVLYSQAFDLKTQKSEGKISNKDYGYAIRSINSQANKADIRIDEIRQDAAKREIEKITEKVAEVSKKLGGKAPMIFETTEEYVQAIAEDQNIDLQKAKSIVEGTEGVFAGESKIFIDKQQAAKVGNIGVAAHEILHPILNALIGDVNQQQEIVKEFENSLSEAQKNKMNVLLSAYADKNGVLDPKVKASEYLTVFSNAIINGDIQYEQSVFEKIGDYIRQLLGKYGFTNANFESGKGVYNFLKEYNKTIQKEGGLSERALELIKKREAETGVKVAEVGTLEGIQASKKLSPEMSAQVGEQITEIKNLQKEGEALAERFNKEFIKSPKQIRIEQQLSENIAPALDALAESTTKRLYDPIAPEAKRNVSRQDYKDALKANWTSMVINEFNPAKQDVETFLSTRGNLRANSLAKELGIEGIAEGGIKADVTEQKALTTEDQTDAGIDEGIDIARREAKLINPVDLIQDENLREKYINAVKAKLKDLNIKGLSFKTLKDLAPEVTAELFNIPVKKVTDAAANLSTGDLSTIQNFINKNADLLLKLLPEGGIDQNQAASEKLLGTSTGVPKKLLDAFYDPLPRGTKGAGLAIQNKRKGITRREFLETFGIVDGKKLEGLSPRGPEAQAMKGLVSLFGRMMTNTVVRQELLQQPGTEAAVQDIAAGKSALQFSKRNKQILKDFNLEKYYYKLDSIENLNKFVKDFETKLLPIFGPNFFKPSQVIPYGSLYSELGDFTERLKLQKEYESKIRKAIKNYKGPKVNWKIEGDPNVQFERISFNSPAKLYGINQNEISDNFSSGKIEKLNKKYNSIFTEMWVKTAEAVKKDPSIAPALMIYYQAATNISSHPHRLGAEMIGYSVNPKGIIAVTPKGKKYKRNYIYEHAVQSIVAYETLITAALDNNVNFEDTLFDIKKDYKLIALDAALDEKLNEAGYADKMPKGWKSWIDRYFNKNVAAIKGGINPETILDSDGITFAEKYNVDAEGRISKLQFSKKEKTLNKQFNDILENKTGIAAEKEYSAAKAEVVGANKGKFNWFIPPTAEDFVGLLYQFLDKGKEGDNQMAWFKVNLLNPYAKAMSAISRDRNSVARNYRALKKELKIVPKDLKKEVPGEGFTKEQAVRVYIWTKQGYDIPGLSKTDAAALRKFVNSDKQLKDFANKLIILNKNEYAKPKEGWTAGTLTTDMLTTLNENVRANHLKEWQENVDVIFSEKNLNKIEAAYGPKFRYAIEDALTRMKTGRNRTYGTDSLTGRLTDWLTNSIGAIMFFNTRSAILQTISSINFINFTDNNLLAASKAFANQKQYWSDFLTLYNSDFLVDRRDGLRLNVNESDIADMAKKGGVRGVISELLKLGFTPTQVADSFAIASGGSTFYRNRIKTYLKDGLSQKAAEEKAFQDFRETAEESQQSSRPDKISQQQAGPLGRIILAFANTPAQYARLMKKAFLDLKNGRGDAKTNISKILYYGAIQNLVFNAMQQALFGIMFGDEEEEDDKKQEKIINVANGMLDSILRGMGISGAIVSVLKNTAIKLIKRSEAKNPQYAEAAVSELLKISPPISSKASKIKNALRSYEWDKDEMYKKGLALDNPAYLAAGNIVSAATNIPLDRVVKKATNVKDAMNKDLQLWQRIALLTGWSDWELGIKNEDKKSKIKTGFKAPKFKEAKYK